MASRNHSHFQGRQRIYDAAYHREFVGLGQRVAPDGNAVRIVSLATSQNGAERRVELTGKREGILVPDPADLLTSGLTETVTVRGELRYADARERPSCLKLVDEKGGTHAVIVAEGLMADVAKPLWEDVVNVASLKRGLPSNS